MTEELKQLREALRRVKYEAAALADAQVIALEALTQRPAEQAGCNHVLYETTDADRPKEICDQNGEVVLAMCKLCSKAEAELETPQPAAQADSMGMPTSCGKPLCSPDEHHPLCKLHQPAAQATPEPSRHPLFAASVAARKWAELQEKGHRMQSLQFDGGPGGAGSIDPWGKVMWATPEPVGEPVAGRCRFAGDKLWGKCSVEHVATVLAAPAAYPNYEAQYLYTHPAPSVPEGFVLVPLEPTWEMRIAASTAYREARDGHYTARMEQAADCWRIMLAAAQAKGAGHG